jgi:bacterioferritin
MTDHSFSIDLGAIIERARENMATTEVSDGSNRDREAVCQVLNDALATEVVCWRRYAHQASLASRFTRPRAAAKFTQHAEEERDHAIRIAVRISQLGAAPDLDPASLAVRTHLRHDPATSEDDLVSTLEQNLAAKRVVISMYQEIGRWLADGDATTRRLIQFILEEEQQQADDILDLLRRVGHHEE